MVWVMGSEVVAVAEPELAAPEAVLLAELVAAAESDVVTEPELTCPEASWSKATRARMAALIVAR